jgi:hypothetical protein
MNANYRKTLGAKAQRLLRLVGYDVEIYINTSGVPRL